MTKYSVYFEIGGKKLKIVVEAKGASDAKEIIKNKIIFHKVKDEYIENISKQFNDLFR